MSKEWLEDWLKDKKEQLKSATVFINENGNEAVEVSLSVLNKLFEQAERVQELEEEIKTHAPHGRNYTNAEYVELLKENKRYREILNDIEKECEMMLHYKFYKGDDGLTYQRIKKWIEEARKALEESE